MSSMKLESFTIILFITIKRGLWVKWARLEERNMQALIGKDKACEKKGENIMVMQ